MTENDKLRALIETAGPPESLTIAGKVIRTADEVTPILGQARKAQRQATLMAVICAMFVGAAIHFLFFTSPVGRPDWIVPIWLFAGLVNTAGAYQRAKEAEKHQEAVEFFTIVQQALPQQSEED